MSEFSLSNIDAPLVIAEIGINHNGKIENAKKLIDAAAASAGHAIKFQIRNLSEIYSEEVLNDSSLVEGGSQYILDELRKAHLKNSEIEELIQYSRNHYPKLFIGATPFDEKSLNFASGLDLDFLKIGSPDFTNMPLIEKAFQLNLPLILSTGMSTHDEILKINSNLKKMKGKYALLHCKSNYPVNTNDLDLNYIKTLLMLEGPEAIGLSCHAQSIFPAICSVALGARIIEKHITLNSKDEGPDHSSSLEPYDFKIACHEIENAFYSLGSEIKSVSQGEKGNKLVLGKSLAYTNDLEAGHILTSSDLKSISPAKGISCYKKNDFIGKKLYHDIKKNSYLSSDHFTDVNKKSFEIPRKWGLVSRLSDFEEFIGMQPDLMEIHLTWRDLVNSKQFLHKFQGKAFPQDLVIHAPEYFHDELIDFSVENKKTIELSTEMIRMTIELAKTLAPSFKGIKNPKGPRVILHPGGHFKDAINTNKNEQYRILAKNLKDIDTRGVRLLIENMPPRPWYFGGYWHNTVFMDPNEIFQFSQENNFEICYDLSHAQLFCNSVNISIKDFSSALQNKISYLHVSDGKKTDQEGMQLGDGDLDLDHMIYLIDKLDVGFIPEIWNGHLNNGEGFKNALKTVEKLFKQKLSGASCSH